MANTPIEFDYFSGETLTADLIAADDTSVATGLSATERTNGKGRYTVTYTGSATGHHTLHVKSGASYVGVTLHVFLADTTDTHYGMDPGFIAALQEITGVSDIPAEPTLRQAMMLLYMWLRNNSQATATERRVLNDAGTEVLDATMADDGTTFTQGTLGAA